MSPGVRPNFEPDGAADPGSIGPPPGMLPEKELAPIITRDMALGQSSVVQDADNEAATDGDWKNLWYSRSQALPFITTGNF